MFWLKLLPVALMMLFGLAQFALDYRWRDRRTRKHRFARNTVVALFLASSAATGVVVYYEHKGGVELSSKLSEISGLNEELIGQNKQLSGQVSNLQEHLEDAKSTRVSGTIFPSNEARPEHDCGPIPDQALALFFGNGVAWVDEAQDSIPLLSIGDQTIVTLYREREGIYLSAIVFRSDGRGIATILGNRFGINPNNYFKITSKDRHELSIVDAAGTQVIKARFLNENTFQLLGVFYVGPDSALVVEPSKVTVGGLVFDGRLCIGENKVETGLFGF